jgi:hypothetical protein
METQKIGFDWLCFSRRMKEAKDVLALFRHFFSCAKTPATAEEPIEPAQQQRL